MGKKKKRKSNKKELKLILATALINLIIALINLVAKILD